MGKIMLNKRFSKVQIICLVVAALIAIASATMMLNNVFKSDYYANAEEKSDAVEFVYQYNSELKVGDTQKVAVGFNVADDAKDSKIVYRKVDSDKKLILEKEAVADNIAYYSTNLVDDSYVGTYIFDTILFGEGSQYKKTINDDSNFLGQFNCTYASKSDRDLPAGIYSIGQDGKLTQVSTANSNQNIMMMTADAVKSKGNISQNGAVVALDPGHGGNDPGACSGGLQEKNLNWTIANACKTELLQYPGISVYMTRTENECPGLQERVERARAAGACLFVSLHNNSGGGSGVEVWAQHKGGWASACSDRGYDIGNRINSKISASLGLANRGVKERYCTDGSTYPDGTQGDYYSVLYWSRYYSIPGIIVEHAFVDGDNAVLANYNNLVTMGKLDAQAIAESYGWKKGSGGGENIVGTYNIEMKASSSAVMDVENSSTEDMANVQIGAKSSSKSQQWRIVTDKEGWATIFNVNSGKVLDVAGASCEPRTNVQQYTFNDTDAQKWAFQKKSDGGYYIASKLGNNQVLDVDDAKPTPGTNIKLFTKSDNIAQSFVLSKVDQPEASTQINGKYFIRYAGGNNQVMDIYGGSKADGGQVDIYEKNGSDAQKFSISTDLDGYATITNIGSGKVLDIENGWTYPNSKVQQYSSNGTDAQKFKIISNSDGTVTFVPKCNENIALDVAGGKAESGTKVWTYYLTFATSQRWVLEDMYEDLPASTADIQSGIYKVGTSLNNEYALEIANASKENGGLSDLNTFDIDSNHKIFAIVKNGNYYYIVNHNSGKALDYCGAETTAGRRVHQWDLDFSNPNQMWGAYKLDDGSIQFVCRANKGYLASASNFVSKGTPVVTVPSPLSNENLNGNAASATSWQLKEPTLEPVEVNGEFYISSALNYGKVVDVAAGSKDNGAKVQLYDINRSDAQKWRITTDSDMYATIINVGSGKALDVAGGNFVKGTNVQQYDSNRTDAQKWIICKADDHYTLRSAGNPSIMLDVACGSTANGTNIQVYDSNKSTAQKFDFTPTKIEVPESTASVADGKYSIMSDISSTRGLNVSGDISANNARVNLSTFKDNVGACAFNIKKAGSYYQITNAASGNALAVDGVNVVTKAVNNNDDAQKWSALSIDGSIQFVNVAYGLYLNVENGTDAEGQNVNVYNKNSSKAQSWTLNVLTSPTGEQVNGTFYISMAKNNSQVMDVAGGSVNDGANIQIYQGNYTGAQKWNVTTDANGIATIKNAQSGKVMDVAGGKLTSGSNVWQYTANGSNAQKFKFIKDGDGYRIYSAANDYLCVDVAAGSTANGANVQMYTANGSDAQKFVLFDVNPQKPTGPQVEIENTTYRIATKLNAGYVVEIAGGSSNNGTNIQLYSFNNTGAQIFWIEKDSGYYRFVNAANGKCIDVDGGKVLPGTRVQLWDKTPGNANQLFAAYDGGNGSIVFQNVASGLVLDLSCGVAALGQKIQGYTKNGSDAQKWVLTKTPYTPPPAGTPIMGAPTSDAAQMARYYVAKVGAGTYPAHYRNNPQLGATSIEAFAQICYEEGVAEGVNPAVMFGQMIHETGWLRFGGSVKVEQCNFGGLGATSATVGGAWFPDIRTGIRAQIQHLKAYGSTAPLVNPCVDPRFHLVSRGCAPLVTDLNGKWAVPGVGYGEAIISHMNEMRKY